MWLVVHLKEIWLWLVHLNGILGFEACPLVRHSLQHLHCPRLGRGYGVYNARTRIQNVYGVYNVRAWGSISTVSAWGSTSTVRAFGGGRGVTACSLRDADGGVAPPPSAPWGGRRGVYF